MSCIPGQILHPPFLVAAHEQAEFMLHRHRKLPKALHHIKHPYGRSLVVLRSASNQEVFFEDRLKGLIFPSVSHRHHIQMIPEADHVIPVLLRTSDSSHVVIVVFRNEAMLPPDFQHLIHGPPARCAKGHRSGSRIGNARNPHQSYNVPDQLLPVCLEPSVNFPV